MRTLRLIGLLLVIPTLDAALLLLITLFAPEVTIVIAAALVVLTALVGMLLVRAEGRRTIRKIQRQLAEGKPPTNELMDGGLLIAAGAFFLTPGLVTDFVALLLTIPVTRIPIRAGLKKYIVTPYLDKQTGGMASGNVWTFGFPQGDFEGGNGQMGGFGGMGSGPGGSGGSSSGNSGGSNADDTYNLGDDSYSIEFEDDE
ncbi:FxsA family protein [Haloarchaeobius sp. HME9146]|uniref:FxsA family protein n=1 Tax=Haloarchaeobius sp. HME9146 TaxID=2978732 RepID=UPI0021BDF96F|nr:FxsA family protein [Haloarchaeobius sp. HME9146]MCT9097807.1 membrane protein FxsA [Haloarchaeobius sp. HME9146]